MWPWGRISLLKNEYLEGGWTIGDRCVGLSNYTARSQTTYRRSLFCTVEDRGIQFL